MAQNASYFFKIVLALHYIVVYNQVKAKDKRRREPTMTKTFEKCNVRITAVRTVKRATVLSTDRKEIVTRNIWEGDNGKTYVQYKGEFHEVSESSYYTHEYIMW